MSSNYEHTTKFKADISSLKQGITQANKELKKIASEYKATSSAAELSGKKQDQLKAKLEYLTKTLEQQNKKLQTYKDQLKTTQDYTQKLGEKEQELTKKLEDAKNKFGANSTEVQKYQKELTAVQKEITSNKDKMDKLNVTINNQQAICNNAAKELQDLGKEAQEMGYKVSDSGDDIEELEEGLDGMGDVITAASTALESFGGIIDSLTDKFQNLLINGVKAVADGIVALGKNAWDSGITFEAAMSQVVATMGLEKASEDYEKLSEVAEYYGATTKFTATQAAEALNYLALAGYKTNDAIALLPTILNLASAGGMDLASASDMVTDAMSALGIKMEDAEKFTDELAKAAQNSNTSVAQLGEAILTIGATARGMENGTVELSTSLGVLANAGIKASEGGTHLRNMLLSLESPTDDAKGLLDELGVSVYDAEGNLRGINTIFQDLKTSMSGFTTEEINNVMATLFNKRDLASANYLLEASGEEFETLASKLENCNGAASQMAETMNDNLQGSLYGLDSAIEGIGIAFYDKLEEPARSVVDSLTTSIRDLIDGINNGEGLSGALDIISNSMMGFAEKLPGLVEEHLPTLIKCFEGVAQIVATIIDYLPVLIETCLPKLLDIINKILEDLPSFMENVLPTIIDLIGWVIENLPTLLGILYSLKGLLAIFKTIIAGLGLGALISKLGALFGAGGVLTSAGGALSGLLVLFGKVILIITGVIGIVISFIAYFQGLKIVTQELANAFLEAFPGIKEFFTNLQNEVSNFSFEEFVNNIKEKLAETEEALSKWVFDTINRIDAFKNDAVESIKEWIVKTKEEITYFFDALPGKIKAWFDEVIARAVEWGTNLYDTATSWVENTCNDIVSWFEDLPSKLEETGKNIIDGLINGVESKWNDLKDSVGGIVSLVKDGFTDALDIHSPSRWMRDFVGKNLVKGLELGITTNENSLYDTLTGLNDLIMSSFNFEELSNIQLGLANANRSINSVGSSNIVNHSTSSVTYNPTFNYNKPLNSREIYRQNKNMLSSVLNK